MQYKAGFYGVYGCASIEKELTQERILVRRGDDFKLLGLGVVSEPAPSRALDAEGLSGEVRLEGIEGPEVGVDGIRQLARLEGTATRLVGGEVGPEEGVVDMTCKMNGRTDLG